MIRISLILSYILILIACERPEKAIAPFDRGSVAAAVVSMSSNYKFQVFYNLDSGKVIKSVNRMDWDLAFDCSNQHILLTNNGRGIYVAKTNKTDLTQINDTFGLKFYWGQPSLNLDSLAFGTWWNEPTKVFVINMGYDLTGTPLGFVKCIPELLSDKSLKFTWSALSSNSPKSMTVPKDNRFIFNYISLLNEKIADVEPLKENWDLVFTQYVKLLFAPLYPATRNYEVVGILQNTSRIETAFDFKTSFKEINSSSIPSVFYKYRDAIGFDWKWFDIGANSYTVNPAMNYILKTKDGFYFKLHFLDFYDDLGVKGSPKFEFQKI